jgi:tRNA (cytosine49-C5)-methyltransferase
MRIPDRFRERYGPLVDDEEKFLSCLEELTPKSFRVNTIKSSADEVMRRFEGYGIGLKGVPWYGDAFICDNPEAGFSLEHFTGAIYMQELVSMLPPLLVREELSQSRFVLDGCAAPGSKTTQIAAMMNNRGTLIANDVSYSRIRALKFNLEKAGVLNTVITNRDLNAFHSLRFETILLDAPCSSEGTIRKNYDVFDSWSESGIRQYSNVQKQLILKAFDMLMPEGTLVYSTCTFAPEENEEVLQHLLDSRPDARLEKVAFEGLQVSETVPSWNGIEFSGQIRNAARIWPHHNNTGGFFLAKVVK